MKRLLLTPIALAAALAGASCDSTDDTIISQLNLDRPVDISFACYGGMRVTNGGAATVEQMITLSPMPATACDIRSTVVDPDGTGPLPAVQAVPPGQEDLTGQQGLPVPVSAWYGFILQSSTGTVALAQFGTKPTTGFHGADVTVLDADPLTPGKNAISVGEDPVAIITDHSGCKEITANAGSCDLSVLDVLSAVDENVNTPVVVDRVQITNAAGVPLRAKPAAMVVEPAGGTIGAVCPSTATGATGLAYIAFPSCHLIAGVDLATAKVVTGLQFDAGGVASIVDGNVTCPDECDGGGIPTNGFRPVAMDLQQDPRTGVRMLVGADNSNKLTIVELDQATTHPLSTLPILLEQNGTGDLGLSNVALSPTIGMGGKGGTVNDDSATGGQFQFAYAVASDNSVRVAEILTLDKECDTNIDSRYVRPIRSVRSVSCFPVGDPANPPRRVGAGGPGIHVSAKPLSIAIFRSDPVDIDDTSVLPSKFIGYFGVITSSNGAVQFLNVDDDNYPDLFDATDPFETAPPLVIANQLRDGLPFRNDAPAFECPGGAAVDVNNQCPDNAAKLPSCDDLGPDPDSSSGNQGPPRAAARPSRSIPNGFVSTTKQLQLPYVRNQTCIGWDDTKPVSDLNYAAPLATRDETYPDLRALPADQTWTFTYEGALSQDSSSNAVDGPRVRVGQMLVDNNGIHLTDPAAPFCAAGVEAYDILELDGCNPTYGDLDCPLGYTCYVHPDSKVSNLGACMMKSEASQLAEICKDFLTSYRNYTIARASTGQLEILPRKHVLRTTPLTGCESDDQCTQLATYEAQLLSTVDPLTDATPADTHMWSCEKDGYRAPQAGTGKRCVQVCEETADCTAGSVCQYGYCLEGVTPPQECINAPQRYSLRASEAFTVLGTASGYLHSITADPTTGACVKSPSANPLVIGRIPLTAPACDPTADPITGLNPAGVREPNPCSEQVLHSELVPDFVDIAQSCTVTSAGSKVAERTATAIKFRNPGLTFRLVDPTYPGDEKCTYDRGGSLANVPVVFPDYQISFRLTAGFAPYGLNPSYVNPAYPVKVVRGPTQSVWIMDAGDYLSTSVSVPSTRGKVFRIDFPSVNSPNILE